MKLTAVLLATACAGAAPKPAACTAPADQVEVAQVQVGWNALASGRPTDPPVIDQRGPTTRYEPDAERLARELLASCEKGEALAPLQEKYSEKAPGTQVIDATADVPFRSAALCMKKGECALFHSAVAFHVLKRVN